MNEWLCYIKKPVLKEQSFIRLKQIVKNRYVPINSIAFGLLKDYKDYVNGKDDVLVLKSNNGKV